MLDLSKLKKASLEKLNFNDDIYENNGGLIHYRVDKTFNVNTDSQYIPLVVVYDNNGYFKKGKIVYRDINDLLIF